MPYHESWQFVVKKSVGFVQVDGVEGLVVEGGAFVGMALYPRVLKLLSWIPGPEETAMNNQAHE